MPPAIIRPGRNLNRPKTATNPPPSPQDFRNLRKKGDGQTKTVTKQSTTGFLILQHSPTPELWVRYKTPSFPHPPSGTDTPAPTTEEEAPSRTSTNAQHKNQDPQEHGTPSRPLQLGTARIPATVLQDPQQALQIEAEEDRGDQGHGTTPPNITSGPTGFRNPPTWPPPGSFM